MNTSMILKGIEVVGVIFAAFGGFLTGIAPPLAADSKFAVGISSFLLLIILFIISALSKKKYRRYWLIASVLLLITTSITGYMYKKNYNALVFEYPPGATQPEHVAGTVLTAEAAEHKAENPNMSNAQLLFDFGGLPAKETVWTAESIRAARLKLISSYVLLTLSIAGAIFAVTEGVWGDSTRKRVNK